MKRKLQTALAAIAFMAFGQNVSAQTYDFELGLGTPVAGITSQFSSTLETVAGSATTPIALTGNTTNVLHPLVFGASNTGVADLDNFPTNIADYSVTWKEYITTGSTIYKKGVVLRGTGQSGYTVGTAPAVVVTGLKQGYYFMTQNNASGSVTFRILKVSGATTLTDLVPQTGRTIGVVVGSAVWYRASVVGGVLKFEYSTNGTTFTTAETAYDKSYTSGGGTQLLYGVGGAAKDYYFDDVTFNQINLVTTTWDGTFWDNGTPNIDMKAIITGSYTEAGDLVVGNDFEVKGTAVVNVPLGKSITVVGAVKVDPTASLTIENNGNLIQQADNNFNTGNVIVKRNSSALSRLDYTLWSSPVASQNLAAFSPLTSQSPSRFYTYNTTTNQYNVIADPTTTSFTTGKGCLIRMPNTAVAYPATETFTGTFTGVPNNGNITVTVANAGVGLGFNLVGNPYPSPITMSTFLATNSTKINSTFYFWRKTNGLGTAYCSYNATTSTFTNNGNGVNPAGVIQTGQGFIVDVKASQTSISFRNSHRVINTTGQFFKTKQVAASDKVWLNATNAAGDFSQMAVTYDSNGTVGLDTSDGKYINDSEFALTSNINDGEYTIQGRPTFDSSDVVGLNFKAITAGDYTIAIDHAEGVFAAGQDVYLVDSTTGTETNLKTDAYTFTAPAGASNARFSLKFQKTLKVDAPAFNDNNVEVYKNKGTLYVNSGAMAIATVKVYDIQGRLIAEQKNVKANTATINNLKATNQVLVVQVTSEDNKVVNKKVVN